MKINNSTTTGHDDSAHVANQAILALKPIQAGDRMNGKPVFTVPCKTVLNLKSGFIHKKLCDGPTFSAGSACAYNCTFCYVQAILLKSIKPTLDRIGMSFQDVVIRRQDPVTMLRKQLTSCGKPRFDPTDNRVVFASPLVDVAANMELARETAEMCKTILELTGWQIRILSKSPLIVKVADMIPQEFQTRMIYGLSTGTLDDTVARAIEHAPMVSKRIMALRELQDRGLRTYGMACPILPQADPHAYAARLAETLQVDRCEHVWAEVLNVRGKSMAKTCAALRQSRHYQQAQLLETVSSDSALWEDYARRTFLALTKVIPGKLRFLQYVKKATAGWWRDQQHGVVMLGSAVPQAASTGPGQTS